jgi:transposase-like protein
MHYSAEEKAELLENWRLSGKTISAYVKEKGLVRWTFTKWIKAERDSKSGFVEVPVHVLKPVPRLPEILIEKGDIRIHIPLGMDHRGLQAVMKGLGAAI